MEKTHVNDLSLQARSQRIADIVRHTSQISKYNLKIQMRLAADQMTYSLLENWESNISYPIENSD